MDFFYTDFFCLINIGSMNIHQCPGVFLSEAGEFSDFEFNFDGLCLGNFHPARKITKKQEKYDAFMINSLRYIRSRNVQKNDTFPGFSLDREPFSFRNNKYHTKKVVGWEVITTCEVASLRKCGVLVTNVVANASASDACLVGGKTLGPKSIGGFAFFVKGIGSRP